MIPKAHVRSAPPVRRGLSAMAFVAGLAGLVRFAAFATFAPSMTATAAEGQTAAAHGMNFTDITAGSGITMRDLCGAPPANKLWLTETMGAGAGWLDFNGDGCLDLYLVNGSTHTRKPGEGEPNRLYKGDCKGHFVDVTAPAGAGDRGWGYGVAIGDIDNDGDPDIYVTNLGPDVLYRNNGDGTFTDISVKAGIKDDQFGTSAAFFDMEGDGDLDLYVANYVVFDKTKVPKRGSKEALLSTCTYREIPVFCGPLGLPPAQGILYRNNGDGTFTDATRAAGFWLERARYGLGVVTGDIDNDGDQDIYIANDSVQNSLFRNRGDGTFEDVAVATLCALNSEGSPQAGMGTDMGDFDGDGWMDLVATNFSQDLNVIYRNMKGKFFIDASTAAGMGPTYMALSWGVGFQDFDNDAMMDLFIANGHVYPQVDGYDLGTRFKERNDLFRSDRPGHFEQLSANAGTGFAPMRSYRGAAFGDFDNDGDIDIVATALDESPVLMRNDTAPRGHYLDFVLHGSASGTAPPGVTTGAAAAKRTNRDAVGARVTISCRGKVQIRERKGGGSYLSASDSKLHFGIGDATVVESIDIRWPDGTKETLSNVSVDRTLVLKQGEVRNR